jgi:hypothetical protein
MIDIAKLSDADVGRKVVYHREHCRQEEGELSSWNAKVIFVRFRGPAGEACEPDDVSFALGNGVYSEQVTA